MLIFENYHKTPRISLCIIPDKRYIIQGFRSNVFMHSFQSIHEGGGSVDDT